MQFCMLPTCHLSVRLHSIFLLFAVCSRLSVRVRCRSTFRCCSSTQMTTRSCRQPATNMPRCLQVSDLRSFLFSKFYDWRLFRVHNSNDSCILAPSTAHKEMRRKRVVFYEGNVFQIIKHSAFFHSRVTIFIPQTMSNNEHGGFFKPKPNYSSAKT